MYDQDESDDYKRLHGEIPSQRVRPEDDAELHIARIGRRDAGRTRVEFRNVLDPAVKLAELDSIDANTARFRVY